MPRNEKRPEKDLLTAKRLRDVLDYDPATGLFRWKQRISIRITVGSIAGSVTCYGYLEIGIDGSNYLAHRLAWLHVKGEWPPGEVDHEDTNGLNNRWANLREATSSQNKHNSSLRRDDRSGFKGVTYCTDKGKFRARIKSGGRYLYLGYFPTAEAAHAAYVAKAKELFGEFARAA